MSLLENMVSELVEHQRARARRSLRRFFVKVLVALLAGLAVLIGFTFVIIALYFFLLNVTSASVAALLTGLAVLIVSVPVLALCIWHQRGRQSHHFHHVKSEPRDDHGASELGEAAARIISNATLSDAALISLLAGAALGASMTRHHRSESAPESRH